MVQEDRCGDAITQHGSPALISPDSVNTEIILHQKIDRNSTRWLDIRYFFVRDAAAKNSISLHLVNSKENAADGFTKSLGVEMFPRFLDLLCMDDT